MNGFWTSCGWFEVWIFWRFATKSMQELACWAPPKFGLLGSEMSGAFENAKNYLFLLDFASFTCPVNGDWFWETELRAMVGNLGIFEFSCDLWSPWCGWPWFALRKDSGLSSLEQNDWILSWVLAILVGGLSLDTNYFPFEFWGCGWPKVGTRARLAIAAGSIFPLASPIKFGEVYCCWVLWSCMLKDPRPKLTYPCLTSGSVGGSPPSTRPRPSVPIRLVSFWAYLLLLLLLPWVFTISSKFPKEKGCPPDWFPVFWFSLLAWVAPC